MIRSLALALLLMPAVASAQDMAITHAEAWTMTGNGKISDATIVVHDGRIVSVTASGGGAAGAVVVAAAAGSAAAKGERIAAAAMPAKLREIMRRAG